MVLIKEKADSKKNKRQAKKGKKEEAKVEVKQEEVEENDSEDSDDSEEEEQAQDVEMAEADVNEEQDSDEDDDEEDDDNEDEEEEEEAKPVKKEKKNKKNKARESMETEESAEAAEKPKERRKETREESDVRSLYIGKLPNGVTEQDLKDLSENIVEVHIPPQKKGIRFAYIRFNNEEDAEANLKILQTKEIKGQPLNVDYVGAKSSFKANENREERNNRKLFVGSLPEDVTEEELNSLSNDIVEIFISQSKKGANKRAFAFLTFETEAKAEENYEILKNEKIRDQPIVVDYSGAKSSRPDPNAPKQVFVSELPLDVTIEQLAPHFQKAFQITLNRHNAYRTATINFDTTEDAKEANEAAKDVTISDQKITAVLRKEREPDFRNQNFGGHGGQFRGRGGNNNWGKRGHSGNFRGGQRFAKRMRY